MPIAGIEVFSEIKDHDLNVELWEWNQEKMTKPAPGEGQMKSIDSLDQCIKRAVQESQKELAESQIAYAERFKGKPTARKRAAASGDLPRSERCRWFHMSGEALTAHELPLRSAARPPLGMAAEKLARRRCDRRAFEEGDQVLREALPDQAGGRGRAGRVGLKAALRVVPAGQKNRGGSFYHG